MKLFIKTIIILLAFSLSTLSATNGQNYYRYGSIDTKLNKRAILEIAKQELRRLVIERKIPKSWKSVPELKIQKNHKKNSDSWIVSFKNTKIKKKKRQTIYLFVSATGDIIGSTYSYH